MSTVKWNSNIMFPSDSNFTARIVSAEFGNSSKGNPMITATWEVVTPEEYEVAGEQVNIAGVKVTTWYVSQTLDQDGEEDKEKTKKNKEQIAKLFTMVGVEEKDINWDNIDTKPLLGKCFLVQMSGKPEPQRKNPTLAQIDAAKKAGNKRAEGDIQKHPVTGKDLMQYWPRINEVFALAPEGHVNMTY